MKKTGAANRHALMLPSASLLQAITLLVASAGIITDAAAQSPLTTIHSFAFEDSRPEGLLLGRDGFFYGVTAAMVYRLSTNGTVNRIHTFTNAPPLAGLVQARDGYLYGSTYFGGIYGRGAIFKLSTNGDYTILHSFTGENEGQCPNTRLLEAPDGSLYGATSLGGTNNKGTIFRISTNGAFTTLYSFADTGRPVGLMQAKDGNLYGTTINGGSNYFGTVFQITTDGVFTNLHLFTAGEDGAQPTAGLAQASDGCLYGTTTYGGSSFMNGTVFRLTCNGELTTLHAFASWEGRGDRTELLQAKDGNLYGTVVEGGPPAPPTLSTCGTVFRVATDGTFTIVYAFTNQLDGGHPAQPLIQGPDGQLYGTTDGGSINCQCSGPSVFRLSIPEQPLQPCLRVLLTNNTILVSWNSTNGGVYQLQYTSDLDSNSWTNLGGQQTASTSPLTAVDPMVNQTKRFYRVMLLP